MKYQYVQTLRNSYELNLMMMCDESTEYRVQSTEYRVQSTEYRVKSIEYRVLGTECRVQSTEYRVQSSQFRVEYRVQSHSNTGHWEPELSEPSHQPELHQYTQVRASHFRWLSRSVQFSLSYFSLDSLSSWTALKVLNLSGNHLKSLTRGSQQSIRLTRLKVLDLSHNNLQVIHQKGEVSVSDDKLQEFSSPFSGFY